MTHQTRTRERAYTVVLRPELEGGFTVLVPALPGIVTYGETTAEALTMAEDAIQLHVSGLEEDGLPVPEEPAPVTTHLIRIVT